MAADTIKIYRYNNYRLYLQDAIALLTQSGMSYRAINTACKFNSSNYLQLVVEGKRHLSIKTARQTALGLQLKDAEARYFSTLVAYESEDDAQEKMKILGKMREQVKKASTVKVKDTSIQSNWLNGVICELAGTKNFVLTAENVSKHLRVHATKNEVDAVIEFLLKKSFLKPTSTPHIYTKAQDTFSAVDDMRNIDLQQCHLRFLELAKHKVHEALSEREFQGLTVAIPRDKFGLVKEEIRKFMDHLDELLSIEEDTQEVIRIQFAAYKVTKIPPQS